MLLFARYLTQLAVFVLACCALFVSTGGHAEGFSQPVCATHPVLSQAGAAREPTVQGKEQMPGAPRSAEPASLLLLTTAVLSLVVLAMRLPGADPERRPLLREFAPFMLAERDSVQEQAVRARVGRVS